MSVQDRMCLVIKEKHLKQSAIAVAAGYDARIFNNMIKGRRLITDKDIVPICKALGISPNELFSFDRSE